MPSPEPVTRPSAVFVSGHMDLTPEEFEAHYAPQVRAAVAAGSPIIVGDAPGCDEMAQALAVGLGADVTVYHMLERPRRCVPGVSRLVGGFMSDGERDQAMTWASGSDVAWVRNRKRRRSSGTAANIARRAPVEAERARRARRAMPTAVVHGDESGYSLSRPGSEPPGMFDEIIRVPEGLLERYEALAERWYALQDEVHKHVQAHRDDPVRCLPAGGQR